MKKLLPLVFLLALGAQAQTTNPFPRLPLVDPAKVLTKEVAERPHVLFVNVA